MPKESEQRDPASPGAALVVGLTGGIGSGKSEAAAEFERLGAEVIDADAIARDVVRPGEPALAEIVAEFGVQVLDGDGGLDRRGLRHLVFAEPDRRARLEAILHPRIRTEMERLARHATGPYCVLCIPLLLESGRAARVDRVLVVDVTRETQIARTMTRDGTSREAVTRILAAQMQRRERLARADDVIENDRDLDHLHRQVRALHQQYLALAAERRAC